MSKNIVLCLDGTNKKFGSTNTNVVKLNSLLDKDIVRQIRFYQNGLGTMGEVDIRSPMSWLASKLVTWAELGFGYGIYSNIKEAYIFLMDNFLQGDKIFVFGFSRGAYTAKALCAIIHQFGLIDKGQSHMIDHMFLYVKNPTKQNLVMSKKFKKDFSRDCKPHFLGLWDAVSSVGSIWNPMVIRYTFDNPDVKFIRNAIAIDERRPFFSPHLCDTDNTNQDAKEVYFAGVHSDVGGGYPESESQLSKFPLSWMIDEAEQAGIFVDQDRKKRILGPNKDYVASDALAAKHNSYSFWSFISEFVPKKVWIPKEKKMGWQFNLFKRRKIPEGSIVHTSALERKNSGIGYDPKNLKGQYIIWNPALHSVKQILPRPVNDPSGLGLDKNARNNSTPPAELT